MTPRRVACCVPAVGFVLVALLGGCGGSAAGARPGAAPAPASAQPKRVHFVGFDASAPLVDALARGKLEGIVVQNPYRMGELGAKTLVQHLEKQEVKPQISTG